jgi:hypothetical protein
LIGTKKQWSDALYLGIMQFLNYGICTISWRAVAQANIMASILTDTSLASLNFFVIKKIAKEHEDSAMIPWLGYTIGGALGTVTGIYSSIWLLGK